MKPRRTQTRRTEGSGRGAQRMLRDESELLDLWVTARLSGITVAAEMFGVARQTVYRHLAKINRDADRSRQASERLREARESVHKRVGEHAGATLQAVVQQLHARAMAGELSVGELLEATKVLAPLVAVSDGPTVGPTVVGLPTVLAQPRAEAP